MAFKNENISEADQQRINYSSFKNLCGSSQNLIGIGTPRWTVDRERDAFMIHIGGGMSREDYHVPYYFLFSWQGEQIRVDAFQQRIPSDDPMLAILIWEVIRLRLPENFTASHVEIMQMLTEAFVTYGNTGTEWSHLKIKAVQVDFSKLEKVHGGVS